MPGPEVTTVGSRPASAQLRRFLASSHFQKLWRYMAVSVITTVLTLVLLYVFYRGLQVGGKTGVYIFGVHVSSAELSNILATGVSTIPSYTLNRKWAWGKSGRSHVWREVVPFWVIAIVSLVLSTYVVGVASREAVHLSSRREVQTILVEIGNLATYGAMWVAKYALFNKVLFKGGERTGREPLHLRGSNTRTEVRSHVTPVGVDGAAAVSNAAGTNATNVADNGNGNGTNGVTHGNGRGARSGHLHVDSLAERSIQSAADAG